MSPTCRQHDKNTDYALDDEEIEEPYPNQALN